MKKHTFLMLFITLLAVLVGCDHNVYLPSDEPYPKEIWEVQSKHFFKFSDALSYYMGTLGSKDIAPENTITLLRDVSKSERGEAIIIPDSFPKDGIIRVDFNNHEYWFEDNLEYFFEVRSGETVEIVNGTTVIDVPANPVPMALVVNTKTVTIDDHLIDDRRPVPKALEVQENGIVTVISSSGETDNALKGEVTVAGGGTLNVEGGFIEATSLNIPPSEGNEKGEVNLSSGYILVSETLNVRENGTVNVSGGLLSVDTIDAKSNDSEKKATINISGGDFGTANLNAGSNSEVNISDASAEIDNTKITEDGSVKVDSGTVMFLSTIETDGTSTFEISGGEIYAPHSLDEKIETAIAADPESTAHHNIIHDFGDWHTTVEPTCTEEGSHRRQCKDPTCALIEEEAIPALGHDMTHYDAVAPTCTEDGMLEHYHCSRCEKDFEDKAGENELSDIVIPAHHSPVHVDAKAPTCVLPGNVAHWHCTVCGLNFEEEECINEIEDVTIPATGHTWGDWVVITEPTCTEEGEKQHTCSVCGTSESQALPALGHDIEGVAWTTTDANVHYKICKRCGAHVHTAEHVYNTVDYVVNGTTLTIRSACSVCGHLDETVTTSPTGPFSLHISDGIDAERKTDGYWYVKADTTKSTHFRWHKGNGEEYSPEYRNVPEIKVDLLINNEQSIIGIYCDYYDANEESIIYKGYVYIKQ